MSDDCKRAWDECEKWKRATYQERDETRRLEATVASLQAKIQEQEVVIRVLSEKIGDA